MCDKSRNTWLCVHWQWNTLEWCQLNARQASPVVHLVTPLSCVSLSMNTQPSVPAIYPCTCFCPSNDGVQFQHTIVQHKWSNPCANGKLNPRTEGTSDHHYRIAFLFAVIIVIMHHHFQTEQYHNGNSGLFVNSIPATDCLLIPNVNLDQAPSAIHSCQFKFSTDLSPNFAYLPVRTINWFDEVKFTSCVQSNFIVTHHWRRILLIHFVISWNSYLHLNSKYHCKFRI